MPIVSQGVTQEFRVGATDGIFVKCTGSAAITYDGEYSAPTLADTSTGEVRCGYFGVPATIRVNCVSGTCEVNTQPTVIKPLVSKQGGAVQDSSALDVAQTVNGGLEFNKTAIRPAGLYMPIDMHYGALMGVGSRSAEPLQDIIFSLANSASAGDSSIVLTNASSGLIVGQLISVRTDDGYFAHRVTSVAGPAIGISPAIKCNATDVSNAVGTFYKDAYHPSVYGYRAIATYAVNNLKVREQVAHFWLNKNSASSTISTDSVNSMLNMGSSTIPAKVVTTTTTATQGAFYQGRIEQAGDFVFDVQTYSTSPVNVYVSIDGNASFQTVIPADYSGLTKCRFTTKENAQQVIIRVCGGGNPATVNVAEVVKIYKERDIKSVNYGRHCLIGDSWFAQDGFAQYLAELLPNATIANKGVGGRKAADILAAFNSDVGERYDFIWCVCGTNDYVSGTAASTFSSTVSRIKGLSVQNGANFIFLGSSVGPADTQAVEFNLSRQYAKLTDLTDSPYVNEYTLMLPTTVVAAGQSQVIVNVGYFDPEITITGYYTFGAGLSVRHKSTITAGSGTQIVALNDNSLNQTKTTYNVGPSRLVDVFANNSSGSPITYGGYITYLK